MFHYQTSTNFRNRVTLSFKCLWKMRQGEWKKKVKEKCAKKEVYEFIKVWGLGSMDDSIKSIFFNNIGMMMGTINS